MAEEAFDFGSLTAGGSESLSVTLVNRGAIPASLQLDLSLYEEFHLERRASLPNPGGNAQGVGGGTDDPQQGGGPGSSDRLVWCLCKVWPEAGAGGGGRGDCFVSVAPLFWFGPGDARGVGRGIHTSSAFLY